MSVVSELQEAWGDVVGFGGGDIVFRGQMAVLCTQACILSIWKVLII